MASKYTYLKTTIAGFKSLRLSSLPNVLDNPNANPSDVAELRQTAQNMYFQMRSRITKLEKNIY